MNICFCNTNKSWGGGEKWHLEMATAFSELEGYKVSFLLAEKSVLNQKINSEKIHKLLFDVNKFSFLNPFKSSRLKKLLLAHHFDLIIFNGPNELKLVAKVAKACGIKKIIYRRGSDKVIKNSFINRNLLENIVTNIIANSEATRLSLLKSGIRIEDKIQVINNGIIPPKNKYPENKNNPTVIGALGRLEPQKGFDLLIQSASVLKNMAVDFKLIIGGSGSKETELRALVTENNLEENIEFAGFIEDSYGFLSKCDVFALSSRYEGFGYVMVEAMFCSLPVVAYNTSSAKEIVIHNETGLLIENYNINEFANALAQLIKNKEFCIELGQKGNQRAFDYFSFGDSVNKIKKIFEDQ
ncbi:glycosyltransferase [Carboxylicivirga caseinilyticus]|uniref:glycosyltransferase n=1 Tax=Carboxylicivirga caseinilyticus TaxID=3417572 RepID=UPI003D334960|nr:glycosyltransferase [Marinilabiliaceae bacterium A049]